MTIEIWSIDRPKPYARNARKITDKAVEKVAASLKEFGFRQPIVVDTDGVIIVGHARLLAAQRLKLSTVPVHVAENLTPAQVKAYRLADNRTNEETSWDFELLGAELKDLSSLDFDMSLTGFDPEELSLEPVPEQPRDNHGRWTVKPGAPGRESKAPDALGAEPPEYPEFEITLDRGEIEAWARGYGEDLASARESFDNEVVYLAFRHLALHFPGELLDGCVLRIKIEPPPPPKD